MKPKLARLYRYEINLFKQAFHSGDQLSSQTHLGRAHVISQQSFFAHFYVHCLMLGYAIKTKNFKEILGQILRLIATIPGHLFGKLPQGNIGWSHVGLLQKMPVPTDIQELLSED